MHAHAGFVRFLGLVFIVFAIAFNLPYAWLAANFAYPDILRHTSAEILQAFSAGGHPLILAWFGFAAAALCLAPVAVGISLVTRARSHHAAAVSAIGIAAGVTQAIGLSRWVYAVPGLAAAWTAATDPAAKASIETTFWALHQFAGVGIGEALGQTLTGFWVIGVAIGQWRHPRFGIVPAAIGMVAGIILLTGFVEGLATVLDFKPGVFGLAALVGYLLLTVWLILTGVFCLVRAKASEAAPG